MYFSAAKHVLNSLVLRRPEMPMHKRKNCSLWVYDLHARSCDAVLDLFGSNRLQDLQNSIHQGSGCRLTLTLVQQIVVSYFN
jgi:hypothetical protein